MTTKRASDVGERLATARQALAQAAATRDAARRQVTETGNGHRRLMAAQVAVVEAAVAAARAELSEAVGRVLAGGTVGVKTAAHRELVSLVHGRLEFERARGKSPQRPLEAFTKPLPADADLVEFDEYLEDHILWRDRLARDLGVPEGDGTVADWTPPRPPEIPADEPEDPALDVETADGTSPRERYEAKARLARYRSRPVGYYSEDGYLLCYGCAQDARDERRVPPEEAWAAVKTEADLRDGQRACTYCERELFGEKQG
jgi:hypothetical protein